MQIDPWPPKGWHLNKIASDALSEGANCLIQTYIGKYVVGTYPNIV